jgi:hypothetical protein
LAVALTCDAASEHAGNAQAKLHRDGEKEFAALQVCMLLLTFTVLFPIRALAWCGVDLRDADAGVKPLFYLLVCELIQFMLADGTTIYIWGRTDEAVFDNNDGVSKANAVLCCLHGTIVAVEVTWFGAVYIAKKGSDVCWQAVSVGFWMVFGAGPFCALALYYDFVVGDLFTVKKHELGAHQDAMLGIYVATVVLSALLAWVGLLEAFQQRESISCSRAVARTRKAGGSDSYLVAVSSDFVAPVWPPPQNTSVI